MIWLQCDRYITISKGVVHAGDCRAVARPSDLIGVVIDLDDDLLGPSRFYMEKGWGERNGGPRSVGRTWMNGGGWWMLYCDDDPLFHLPGASAVAGDCVRRAEYLRVASHPIYIVPIREYCSSLCTALPLLLYSTAP